MWFFFFFENLVFDECNAIEKNEDVLKNFDIFSRLNTRVMLRYQFP